MTTQWVLIVFIAADLWTAVASFDTEAECYAALARWEFRPPARATCLSGVIETRPETARRTRRK